MINNQGQSQSQCNLYPVEGRGRLFTANCFRRSGKHQVNMLRYLMSKWILEGPLNQRETLTLSELILASDRWSKIFKKKWRDLTEDSTFILKNCFRASSEQEWYARGGYPDWFLGLNSLSGYYGSKALLSKMLSKVVKVLVKIPPKPYIGRGYTDKGNRRDVCLDNSPSWQEVSSQKSKKEGLSQKWDQLVLESALFLGRERLGVTEDQLEDWSEVAGEDFVTSYILTDGRLDGTESASLVYSAMLLSRVLRLV